MATKFPSMYPGWSWSKKNSAIPKSVKITTSRSALRTFVLYISAVNITINTGEVNCSTIAFAAVVSLFAQVKASIHTRGENPRDKGLLCEDELHPLYKHIHHKKSARYKAAHARNGKAVPRYELHYYSRNAPERCRREHFKHNLGFLFHRVPRYGKRRYNSKRGVCNKVHTPPPFYL